MIQAQGSSNFYAMETYIMHFLEAAQFLNAPVLAGRKVNVLYAPGLAFFWPKQLLPCLSCFRAQKSLEFHGPTLPMARVMPSKS